ncbi:MAG: UDP-N-acetylmuramate dehydrogenase [bacterium]
MDPRRHHSLKLWNTFGIDARASGCVQAHTLDDLRAAIDLGARFERMLVLGGGSNVLFVRDFDGLVVRIELRGIRVLSEDAQWIEIEVAAGESWPELVAGCVERSWGGLENLSLIPGTAGGAPVQNVGAYGAELKDVLLWVAGIDTESGRIRSLSNAECLLGYRASIFKGELKGRFVITSVALRLSKCPVMNTSYESLAAELCGPGNSSVTLLDVSRAVCRLRKRRIPDPGELGNAGSFFKNPEVSAGTLDALRERFPSLPAHPSPASCFRIPAGWLIEQCGWKGKRVGSAGVYEKHALILVNYGGATGREVLDLARRIQDSVRERFGIGLEPEVQIV